MLPSHYTETLVKRPFRNDDGKGHDALLLAYCTVSNLYSARQW